MKREPSNPGVVPEHGGDQRSQHRMLAFARMKPSFKGYEEWSSVIGDGMSVVWTGEAELDATLDEVVKQADEVLAKNK